MTNLSALPARSARLSHDFHLLRLGLAVRSVGDLEGHLDALELRPLRPLKLHTQSAALEVHIALDLGRLDEAKALAGVVGFDRAPLLRVVLVGPHLRSPR